MGRFGGGGTGDAGQGAEGGNVGAGSGDSIRFGTGGIKYFFDEAGKGVDWDDLVIYLGDLEDVTITTPLNGQLLIYNEVSEIWENGDLGASQDWRVAVYEAGVQVGTTSRMLDFDGTNFDVTESAPNNWFNIQIVNDGHSHTGTTITMDHVDLNNVTPNQHHDRLHALDDALDHSGELPLTDLVAGSQGSVIRRGAADWEEHALGTLNYVLKSGASDVDWGQVDYSELTGVPGSFVPSAHAIDIASGFHTGSLPLIDLAPGSQGSVIRRGAADWEELGLGTTNYYLASTATDADWQQIDHTHITNVLEDQHHARSHALDSASDHTGTLPLTDLAVGAQGSIIRRGAADWEEYPLGTTTYVLKAGATDPAWGQVDYSELTGIPPAGRSALPAGTPVDIDFQDDEFRYKTLTSNTVFTISNPSLGDLVVVELDGLFTVTLPATVNVVNGDYCPNLGVNFLYLFCTDAVTPAYQAVWTVQV